MDEDEMLYRVLILFSLFAAVFTGGIYALGLEKVFMTECPFWRITGLYCPGCGGTRAFRALLKGQIVESICIHPLVVYLTGLIAVFMGSHTLKHISSGRIRGLHYRSRYLIIGAVILVVNCLFKNYYLVIKGIGLPGQ